MAVLGLAFLTACTTVFPVVIVRTELTGAQLAALSPADYVKAVNDARLALLQGIAGAVLLLGAYGTWRQLRHTVEDSREQREIERQGQLTERFGRSVELLGNENSSARLGGIHALDRIASESARDREAIVHVLAAYVRVRSPWPPPDGSGHPADQPIDATPPLRVRAMDVQAALTVLGRWGPGEDAGASWPTADLSHADLRLGNLENARLWRVRLHGSNLAQANLRGADLRGADLEETVLEDADLAGALADETTWWPGPGSH
ncbi:pentapeptide repeat-containing protein [Amycolatopsis stemonae]